MGRLKNAAFVTQQDMFNLITNNMAKKKKIFFKTIEEFVKKSIEDGFDPESIIPVLTECKDLPELFSYFDSSTCEDFLLKGYWQFEPFINWKETPFAVWLRLAIDFKELKNRIDYKNASEVNWLGAMGFVEDAENMIPFDKMSVKSLILVLNGEIEVCDKYYKLAEESVTKQLKNA